ncbi:MAG: STAS-like domain-containing protein [Alphaproteobacteria bacterium]|nr:STAS-like domain-containing protein [Alphaproteobacteria bacterium]
MEIKNISIANDFSKVPAGRFYNDGPYSGEKFRKEFLVEPLRDRNVEKIIINLNGLCGVGSSFWDEAFVSLITEDGFSYDEVTAKIEFTCSDDDTLIPLLKGYLKEAKNV